MKERPLHTSFFSCIPSGFQTLRTGFTKGGDGYFFLDTLRTYSSTTAALLHVVQGIVLAHRNEQYETNDVVHFDYNPSIILIEQIK
jgi:hypothetical protein